MLNTKSKINYKYISNSVSAKIMTKLSKIDTKKH